MNDDKIIIKSESIDEIAEELEKVEMLYRIELMLIRTMLNMDWQNLF